MAECILADNFGFQTHILNLERVFLNQNLNQVTLNNYQFGSANGSFNVIPSFGANSKLL